MGLAGAGFGVRQMTAALKLAVLAGCVMIAAAAGYVGGTINADHRASTSVGLTGGYTAQSMVYSRQDALSQFSTLQNHYQKMADSLIGSPALRDRWLAAAALQVIAEYLEQNGLTHEAEAYWAASLDLGISRLRWRQAPEQDRIAFGPTFARACEKVHAPGSFALCRE